MALTPTTDRTDHKYRLSKSHHDSPQSITVISLENCPDSRCSCSTSRHGARTPALVRSYQQGYQQFQMHKKYEEPKLGTSPTVAALVGIASACVMRAETKCFSSSSCVAVIEPGLYTPEVIVPVDTAPAVVPSVVFTLLPEITDTNFPSELR